MLRQASCSGTVPGPHGMWSSQELDVEWLACATEAAGEEWPEWPGAPSGSVGAGAEFAAGGLLDRLTPGPALAGFAQNAWADGLGTLSDDALVGVLQAWRRLASWGQLVSSRPSLSWTAAAGPRWLPGPTRIWPSMWAMSWRPR